MKKSLIFKILYLFLVLIIIAGASVFATNTYLSARYISYGSSNVEDALNGLFTLKGNDENYSTEEKIVGKWIDGKNIYRKVFNFDNTDTIKYSDNSWYKTSFSLPNTNSVLSALVVSPTPETSYSYAVSISNDIINIMCFRSTNYIVVGAKLIVEYTKITD